MKAENGSTKSFTIKIVIIVGRKNGGVLLVMCPTCVNVELQEIKKESVLIDVCPTCKGIWLDRGELETIVRELKKDRTKKSGTSSTKDKKETTMLEVLSDVLLFW